MLHPIDLASPSAKTRYSRPNSSNADKYASHAAKLQELKSKLTKSTKEQEEDNAAEIRYAHFIMLQSLGKRMKKFYKHEYSQHDSNVQNFRKASELKKQVPDQSKTSSAHSSIQDVTDSSCIDDISLSLPQTQQNSSN